MKNRITKYVFISAVLTAFTSNGFAQLKKKVSLIGKTDLHALLEAAPAVPLTVAAAVARAYGNNIVNPDFQMLESYYRPLHEKVEAAQKSFEAYREELRSFQEEQGAEGLTKLAMGNSAAAAPAMPDMPGMKGFMQKYMSDKSFAAQYDRMNEAEKEKLIKGFMDAEKEGSSTASIPANYQQFEKDARNSEKVRTAIKIQELLSEMQLRIEKYTKDYEDKLKALATGAGNFAEIRRAYDNEYAKIPLVVMGEGHEKDPAAVKNLIAKDVTAIRARNEEELSRKALWLTDLKAKYKLVVNDYNDLLQKYRGTINGSVKDLYKGTNTEAGLADFELSLMDLASRLGRFSEQSTELAARTEREQFFRTRK